MGIKRDESEARIMTVTPEMAAEWLKRNMPNNRKINTRAVKQYAEDMKRGAWTISYEPIVFNNRGELENGQHRLSAVCLANVAVEFYVVKNAIPSPGSYDRGVGRSTKDALYVRDNLDRRLLQSTHISTAKAILRDLGVLRASDSLVEEFISKFGEEIDRSVCATRQVGNSNQPICKKSSIIKVIFYAIHSGFITPSNAERFCKIANSGFYSAESESSAVVMRNQLLQAQSLLNVHRNGFSGWEREYVYERLASLAINDFVTGKTRTKAYRLENSKAPKFISDAIRLLRMEMTSA